MPTEESIEKIETTRSGDGQAGAEHFAAYGERTRRDDERSDRKKNGTAAGGDRRSTNAFEI
jgi:hypothetical protein